jgi:MFS family permease
MADDTKVTATAAETAPEITTTSSAPVPRPPGWMYRGFKIGGKEVWYASPPAQLLLVSVVCFLCPGMFNALTGIGAGGQVNSKAQADAATALYSTFAVVAFFSGSIANTLGVKITLAFGGLGYSIYAASFLSYNHNGNTGFVIFAGAFLGVCAGLLWTAQGTIMVSYPPEAEKGRYISWFWMIFNMGGVVGALVLLGQNAHQTAGPVTDGTYIGLIVLMLLGAVLALGLCNAGNVVRKDGSKVILMKNPSFVTEVVGLFETLTQNPWVTLLFPMFFSSNIFYTYQLNNMNGAHFTTRTRALNNTLYWTSQIIGASIFGYALDFAKARRTVRAKASLLSLVALTFIIWGGGWAWQKNQAPREIVEADEGKSYVRIDWTDGSEYLGPMFLLMFYAFYDAAWQTCIYWYIGALSNSGRKAANLTGFYKGIQSAGAAVFWRLDGLGISYNAIFGATWGLLAASLIFAAPVIWLNIKDTVSIEEDLKFSDETIEDVVVTGAAPVKYSKEEAV